MTATATLLTAEDVLKLPPDNLRHELIRGELTTMPPTSSEHGVRTGRITLSLGAFISKHDLGLFFGAETGFVIAHKPDTVRAPDFAFIRKERVPANVAADKFWPGPPDLAVEVLSPSDLASEVLEKINEWLAAGVRLVWVVDPEKKTVSVYAPQRQPQVLRMGEVLLGEELLPGLELSVAEILR